jgi:AcrR family transcriptional regulator
VNREALLAATYRCVEREGVDRTTVEDAAREAGVSRATVYRWFPGGRDELLTETIAWQTDQFFLRLAHEVEDLDRLEDVVATALQRGHALVREHEVLQRLVATEAARVVTTINDEVRRLVPEIAAFIEPWLPRPDPAAAEYVARMVLSLIGSPGRWDLDDPEQVLDLVRTEVLAGIR